MESIRTFIAIEVSQQIKYNLAKIRKLLNQLKQNGHVKMSIPKVDNLHLTLQFLGQTPLDCLELIESNVKNAVQGIDAFELKICGVGAFPNLNHPKILWAGVEKTNELNILREKVVGSTADLPLKTASANYYPHLTLARVKKPSLPILQKLIKEQSDSKFGTLKVNSLSLIKSELTQSGSIYTEICNWPLGKMAKSKP